MAYTDIVVFDNTNLFGCTPEGHDDVYTIEEFRACCASGAFMDFDGFGYPVRDNLADSEIEIYPSRLRYIPEDATHIVWYNK